MKMGFLKSFITGDWDEWHEEQIEKMNRKYAEENRKSQEECEKAWAEFDMALTEFGETLEKLGQKDDEEGFIMAKKEKVTMLLKDGVEVHNLDELQENFDLGAIMGYFKEGILLKWLDDRYYDDEAEKVEALSPDTPNLGTKLCAIFGVEAEGSDIDMESLARLKEKQSMLRNLTDSKEIIDNAMYTAFDQEDLAELLDEKCSPIYLCGDKFTVSARRVRDTNFVGILNMEPEIKITAANMAELRDKGISFKNVKLPGNLVSTNVKVLNKILSSSMKKVIDEYDNYCFETNFTKYCEDDICDFDDDEKKLYMEFLSQGKYSGSDIMGMHIAEDYSKGFMFTVDSFCYCSEATGVGSILYSEVNEVRSDYCCVYINGIRVDCLPNSDYSPNEALAKLICKICNSVGCKAIYK